MSNGSLISRLYEWTLARASHPRALWLLALVSFVESSVFPIPPDVLLIPMVLARPHRAFTIAFVCTASSVLGGLAGYALGAVAYDQLGRPILELWGQEEQFARFTAQYNEYGGWAVLVAGITPFPYKIITILSGAAQLSVPVFVLCSMIARGARFFLVAAVLWKFGPPLRAFIEKRLGPLSLLFAALLIGTIFLVELL